MYELTPENTPCVTLLGELSPETIRAVARSMSRDVGGVSADNSRD